MSEPQRISFVAKKTGVYGTAFISNFILRDLKRDFENIAVYDNGVEVTFEDYSIYFLSDFNVKPINQRANAEIAQCIKGKWTDYMLRNCGLKYWLERKFYDSRVKNAHLITSRIDANEFILKK